MFFTSSAGAASRSCSSPAVLREPGRGGVNWRHGSSDACAEHHRPVRGNPCRCRAENGNDRQSHVCPERLPPPPCRCRGPCRGHRRAGRRSQLAAPAGRGQCDQRVRLQFDVAQHDAAQAVDPGHQGRRIAIVGCIEVKDVSARKTYLLADPRVAERCARASMVMNFRPSQAISEVQMRTLRPTSSARTSSVVRCR